MTSDVDAELEGIRRERKAREASHGGNRHALSAGLNVWNAGNDTAAEYAIEFSDAGWKALIVLRFDVGVRNGGYFA